MKKYLLPAAWTFVVLAAVLLLCAAFSESAPEIPAAEAPDAPEPTATAPPPGAAAPVSASSPEELLASMSLEEKALQMLLYCCQKPEEAEAAARRGVGGLCLFANAFSGKTREDVVAMTAALQEAAPIPLLLAVDEEGGTVCRVSLNPALRSSPFRSPRALYKAGRWALIESDTEEKSRLLLDLGLNVNLAPVCDVPHSSLNFIYDRCLSGDAVQVAEYADRVVRVMKEQGVGCVLKHFPGYGGSADTHRGLAYDKRPRTDFTGWDLLPFESGIEAGADAVMVSHNIVQCMDPELPASLSPEVHRLLREELGFTGVVVTDDLSMGAIVQFTGGQNAAVQAVLAGNDLLCCGDIDASAEAVAAAVRSGAIDEAQLDASVLRVLRWKQSLGLLAPAAS